MELQAIYTQTTSPCMSRPSQSQFSSQLLHLQQTSSRWPIPHLLTNLLLLFSALSRSTQSSPYYYWRYNFLFSVSKDQTTIFDIIMMCSINKRFYGRLEEASFDARSPWIREIHPCQADSWRERRNLLHGWLFYGERRICVWCEDDRKIPLKELWKDSISNAKEHSTHSDRQHKHQVVGDEKVCGISKKIPVWSRNQAARDRLGLQPQSVC